MRRPDFAGVLLVLALLAVLTLRACVVIEECEELHPNASGFYCFLGGH